MPAWVEPCNWCGYCGKVGSQVDLVTIYGPNAKSIGDVEVAYWECIDGCRPGEWGFWRRLGQTTLGDFFLHGRIAKQPEPLKEHS